MKTAYTSLLLFILLALGLFTVPAHNEEQTNSSTTLNNVKPACGIFISGPDWIVVNDDDNDEDEEWDYEVEPVPGEDDTKMIVVSCTMPETCEGTATVDVTIKNGLDKIEGFWPGKKTILDKEGNITSEEGDDALAREKGSGKSHPYTFDVAPGQTVKVHLWIEGIKHSTSGPKDVLIEAKTSSNTCSIHGALGPEKLEMQVYQADVDVDSDNLHGFEFAGFTDEEDKIENSDKEVDGEPRLGKVVLPTSLLNSDDDDVPDYADGFALTGMTPLEEPASVTDQVRFIPVRVEIKEPFDPDSANIVFEFPEESKPIIGEGGLIKNGDGTPESPVTIAVAEAGFRLWKKKPEARTSGEPVPDGDWIPQGEKLKWTDITDGSGSSAREARLYLEYLDTNPPVLKGKKLFSITVTEDYDGPEYIDEVKINPIYADIDIDSDNNNRLDDPDRGDVEEGYQYARKSDDSISKPGKILIINDGDIDADGVPDFADGLSNKFEADGMKSDEGLDESTGVDFIPQSSKIAPMLLDISNESPAADKLFIRFEYDASDPAEMEKAEEDPESRAEYRLPEDGSLRIWTRETDEEELRSITPARDGGHYVPDGHIIRWNDLKAMLKGGPGTTKKLWIEAVKASETIRDQQITISLGISPNAEGAIQWMYDEVLDFTTIGQQMVDIASDGSTSPASGYAMSHCSPVIKLNKKKVGEAYATKYSGWKVDVDIEGTITSDFLDTVTAAQGNIDHVKLYLNNNDLPFATVDVDSTRNSNPGNLAKPFSYLGSFSYKGEAVGAVDGDNILTVRTQDTVFELDGIVVATFKLDLPELDYEQLPPPPTGTPEGEDYTCFTTSASKSSVYEIHLLDGLDPEVFNNIKFTSVTTIEPSPPASSIFELLENVEDSRFFVDGSLLIRIETQNFEPDPEAIGWFEAGFYHLEDGVPVLDRTMWFIESVKDSDKYYAWEEESEFVGYSVAGGGGTPITSNPVVVQPTVVYTSDGGEFHPQAMEMLGPKALLESLVDVKFSDLSDVVVEEASASVGFEAKFNEVDDKLYVANTHAQDVTGVVCYRENLTGDQFPSISEQVYRTISMLQTKSLYPDNLVDFAKGFAAGLGKGGVDMVGGYVEFGKTAIKVAPKVIVQGVKTYVRAYAWGLKFGFKLITGQSVEQEIHEMKECVSKVTEKIENFFNLAEEGIDVANAILTGDFKRLDNLSGTMRDIVQAGVEIFVGMAENATGTDYEKGVFWGRGTFEIASNFFPLAKVGGVVSKIALFDRIAEKSDFFKTERGINALARAQPVRTVLPNTIMCFVPGTPVWTSEGLVPIEQIRPGDLVWSRPDDGIGAPALKPVVHMITTVPSALVEMTVDLDDDGVGDDVITGTPSHPFWLAELGGFVPMGEIKPGQTLSLVSGVPASVLTVTTLRGPPSTYTHNFEVADFHTYYVGNAGIWVHNEAIGTSPVPWCQIVLSGFEELAKSGRPIWDAYDDFATGSMGKNFDVENWPRWRLRLFNEVRQKHFANPSGGLPPWNNPAKLLNQVRHQPHHPATTLRDNILKVTGMTDPGKDFSPHHIVMTVTSTANPLRKFWSEESRSLLNRFEIDINDASNGVFLPKSSSIPPDFDEKVYGYLHRGDGIHSNAYMKAVYDDLMGVAEGLDSTTALGREAGAVILRNKLQEIAYRLAKQDYPVD